jgi:hypothetical protein
MKKNLLLLFVVLAALLASAGPVLALQAPVSVHVWYDYNGSEDGSQERPYNTMNEANYYARNQPGGGWIYVKQADGSWKFDHAEPYVFPGPSGTPLAGPVLFALLALASLILIAAGWFLLRRAQPRQG